MNTQLIYDHISRFLMIIPPIVGMLRWGYMDIPTKIFYALTCFNFLISTTSIIGTIAGINTYFLSYINVVISLITFILLFRSSNLPKNITRYLPIVLLPLLTYIIYELITKKVLFSVGLFIYHDIIVVILTAYLLIHVFNENKSELRTQPHFWICCSILLFYNFDLIFSFLVANVFTTLNTFFSILFFKIYPTFNLTFTIINTYIFYKTKHWQKSLKR